MGGSGADRGAAQALTGANTSDGTIASGKGRFEVPPRESVGELEEQSGDDEIDLICSHAHGVGLQLLRETFAPEFAKDPAQVDACWRTVLTIVRSSANLLDDNGREALTGLARMWTGEAGRRGARAWARLLEPFLHRLDQLTGERGRANKTLPELLATLGLLTSPPSGTGRETWVAGARRLSLLLSASTGGDSECLRRRLGDRACGARNRAAHGIFPDLSLVEQVKILEAVVTTMTAAVQQRTVAAIERGMLYEELSSQSLPEAESKGDVMPWVAPILDGRALSLETLHDSPLTVVVGSRGMGKTKFAKQLHDSLLRAYGHRTRCPIWVDLTNCPWDGSGRAPAEILLSLMKTCVPLLKVLPRFAAEMDNGWYHFVIDGTESFPLREARTLVHGVEVFRSRHPDVALTIVFPHEIGDAALGTLGQGKIIPLAPLHPTAVIRELVRRGYRDEDDLQSGVNRSPRVAALLSLPRFLHLLPGPDADSPGLPGTLSEFLDHIVRGRVGAMSPVLWEGVPPEDRETGGVLAQLALHAICQSLFESASGEISEVHADRAVDSLVHPLLPWAPLPNKLLEEIRNRLTATGLVVGGGPRGYRIVHPALQTHCGRSAFLRGSTKRLRSLGQRGRRSWANLAAAFPDLPDDRSTSAVSMGPAPESYVGERTEVNERPPDGF